MISFLKLRAYNLSIIYLLSRFTNHTLLTTIRSARHRAPIAILILGWKWINCHFYLIFKKTNLSFPFHLLEISSQSWEPGILSFVDLPGFLWPTLIQVWPIGVEDRLRSLGPIEERVSPRLAELASLLCSILYRLKWRNLKWSKSRRVKRSKLLNRWQHVQINYWPTLWNNLCFRVLPMALGS